VPTLPKKIRRRRRAGEISVEQTHDITAVEAILERAGMPGCISASAAACVLVGYCGNDPAGIVCLETQVEAALMRWLLVFEPMRRRGLGAALVHSARSAAHTRGARTLYAMAPGMAGDYLARFAFKPVAMAEITDTFGPSALELRYPALEWSSFYLDISRDGLIDR
jgi:N-acetylglutamate synthase-like GNAT family acetyltransferase